ncbi:Sterile alpha motif domain-containing protein [Carex littledalei]|uniref:Sterile alpha motif domain-containing protein n=1 Tax=Carex littledalei TaxID=544730 RepID=A0A833RGE0_9POAL|nr:Sterile alpha motif domain-containing protein [Carex littledalei]
MYWYTWLSKTDLDKSLVYDYSLLFSRNELEEEDISHFNHEFLQSMGISIAKHRLEILKLSKKYKPVRQSQPSMTRLLTAFSRTKQCLARCIKALVHREYSSAIVVVHRPPPKKAEMLKRSRRSEATRKVVQQRPPQMIMAGPKKAEILSSRGVSPLVFEEGFGSGLRSVESIRWDSMFQGLKPT